MALVERKGMEGTPSSAEARALYLYVFDGIINIPTGFSAFNFTTTVHPEIVLLCNQVRTLRIIDWRQINTSERINHSIKVTSCRGPILHHLDCIRLLVKTQPLRLPS